MGSIVKKACPDAFASIQKDPMKECAQIAETIEHIMIKGIIARAHQNNNTFTG